MDNYELIPSCKSLQKVLGTQNRRFTASWIVS